MTKLQERTLTSLANNEYFPLLNAVCTEIHSITVSTRWIIKKEKETREVFTGH